MNSTTTGKNRLRRLIIRIVFCLAIIATLIALSYTEENWRGRRAWEKYKREATADGSSMDWKDYIPAPVPDDQNFFGAPNMQDWFTGRGSRDISRRMDFSHLQEFLTQRGIGVVADVTIVQPEAKVAVDDADIILRYDNGWLSLENIRVSQKAKLEHVRAGPKARSALKKLIDPKVKMMNQTNLQPYVTDVNMQPLGRDPSKEIAPVKITVRSSSMPDIKEVSEFFGAAPTFKSSIFGASRPTIITGSNTFRVQLSPPPYNPAAEFLAYSDQFQDDFAAIRNALERPYSRLGGDYTYPFSMPIPNFVNLRMTAQVLALRSQSYLLLGKPDKALAELTLMNSLEHICDQKPTGLPMTLVAAMINVAIKGLYVSTMSDGLRMKAWNDSQLMELQSQLSKIDLTPMVHDSFQSESVAMGQNAENFNASNYFSMPGQKFWQKIKDPLYDYLKLAPRGWLFQSAVVGGPIMQKVAQNFNLTNHLIQPEKVDAQNLEFQKTFEHFSPYSYLVSQMTPNFINVAKRMGKTQTLLNEAFIVCGLERYRLVHDRYPETLDELVPKFAGKLPIDMIGGGPLKYRLEREKFVLYSIGWNQKDDGGIPAFDAATANSNGGDSGTDWVWPYENAPAK